MGVDQARDRQLVAVGRQIMRPGVWKSIPASIAVADGHVEFYDRPPSFETCPHRINR